MEESKRTNVNFSDYLYVLFKWKKFLIINIFIVALITTGVAFIIPKTFKATATIMLPPEQNMGLAGLLSGGNSMMSLGSKFFGITNTSEDLIQGLLNSRSILLKVSKRFNLFDYYGIDDYNIDKLLKYFQGDLQFEPNEFGFIDVSVINKSPEVSAQMANYFVHLADSLNIKLNIEQSTNNRIFVERRYNENQKALKLAEENYYLFQKKYGIFDIPEQVKVAIEASGQLEAKLIEKQIILNSVKYKLSPSSPQYKDMINQIFAIKQKMKELIDKPSKNSLMIPFKDIPNLQLKYMKLFREVKIQNKILEFIYPLFEQAKIDENKNLPTLMIIDQAIPPQLKYAPKKAFIIVFFTIFAFFIFIPFIFRAEKIYNADNFSNPLESKENKFYSKIISIYHMKF